MARTSIEIRDSLAATVKSTDPSADVDKGPIFDFLIAPIAPELAETEAQVEQLRQLTSLQLPNVASTPELNAIGTSFGLSVLRGKNSSCRQTFYTVSRPTTDILIPRGTIVGTADGSYLFTVDEQVTLPANQADIFFVNSRRRYEITARVVAVASGPDFDLPQFRIVKLFSNISGISGTENREASTGGVLQQSNNEYFRRIQTKFAGLNAETGGGIISRTYELNPTAVVDVVLVFPKDRNIFYRDVTRPSIDSYIIGTVQYTTSFGYTSTFGGETLLTLPSVPVLTVNSVIKNNISLTTSEYALLSDTNPATRLSARALDRVVFTTPLVINDQITVNYTYNKLIADTQSYLYNSNTRLFDTDILARMPLNVPVTVEMAVTVLQSFDTARVIDAVTTQVYLYCSPQKYVDMLLPEVLKQNILNNVAGVSNVTLSRFTKTNGSAVSIETIGFEKNELPSVDQARLVIKARQ